MNRDDGHGNMVMTLSRSGNGWSDGLHRSYDVWGSVRWNPSNSGDVKQRYCANLGHVEDDASGLVYMIARYYEPWTGRFISEDPAMDGLNWYVFANNSQLENVDPDGRINWKAAFGAVMTIAAFALLITTLVFTALAKTPAEITEAVHLAEATLFVAVAGQNACWDAWDIGVIVDAVTFIADRCGMKLVIADAAVGSKSKAWQAVLATTAFTMVVMYCLVEMVVEESMP